MFSQIINLFAKAQWTSVSNLLPYILLSWFNPSKIRMEYISGYIDEIVFALCLITYHTRWNQVIEIIGKVSIFRFRKNMIKMKGTL